MHGERRLPRKCPGQAPHCGPLEESEFLRRAARRQVLRLLEVQGCADADQPERRSVRLLGRRWSGSGPELGMLGRDAAVGACLEGRSTRDIARTHGVPVRCGGMPETGMGRTALPGLTLPGATRASHRRSPWKATAGAAQHFAGKRRPAASPAESRPAVCGDRPGVTLGRSGPSTWPDRTTGHRAAAHGRSHSARPPTGAQDGRGRGCDAGVRGPRVEVRVLLIRSGAIFFGLVTMSRCGSTAATQNRAASL